MVTEYSVFVLKAIVLSRLPCGTCKKSDTGLSFVLVISKTVKFEKRSQYI